MIVATLLTKFGDEALKNFIMTIRIIVKTKITKTKITRTYIFWALKLLRIYKTQQIVLISVLSDAIKPAIFSNL